MMNRRMMLVAAMTLACCGMAVAEPQISVFGSLVPKAAKELSLTVPEVVTRLQKAGVRGFDDDFAAPARIRQLTELGLTCVNLYCFLECRKPCSYEPRLDRLVELAAQSGARRVMVIPAPFTDGKENEADIQADVKMLAYAVNAAKPRGVTVTVEDFGAGEGKYPCNHVKYLKRYLDEVPGLAFTLDSGNLFYANRGESIVTMLHYAKGRIAHLHLKDIPEADRERYVTLGEGGVENEQVVRALAAWGYRGWVTLEDPVGPDRLADVVRQVARVREWMASGAAPKRPLLVSSAVDFLDDSICTPNPDYFRPEEIRASVKKAHDAGIRRLYFRDQGGRSYYESKYRAMYAGDRREYIQKCVTTIGKYDPVPVYIEACHALGMELCYWHPIFDNYGYMRNYPGMEDYERFGASGSAALDFPPDKWVEHRHNKSHPRENLPRPITKMRVRVFTSDGKLPAELSDKTVLLYTAPHDQPFTRYTKPFTVSVEPTVSVNGHFLVLTGLEIADPVIKFASDEKDFHLATYQQDAGNVTSWYADGSEVTLLRSVESVIEGDVDREHKLWGAGRPCEAWGGVGGPTMIVRYGDFERYAMGVPEFAHAESRQRLVNIVTELYERYPRLDGVTLSIRSHCLPASGMYSQLGCGEEFYGFCEEVSSEYRRRYGVDPRTEDFDQEKMLKLRGEYITKMLEEVAAVVHAKGSKLQMMAPADRSVYKDEGECMIAHGSQFPWWMRTNIDNMFDIGTWARRGLVDGVLMLGTAHKQTEWTPAWKNEVKRFKDRLAGTGVKLALHFICNDAPASYMRKLFPKVLAEEAFDEVEIYEEYWLREADPDFYPCVRETIEEAGRNR